MSDYDDSIRKVFKGSGILLAGLVIQLGISFLGKLIVARGLSVADFGAIALGMTTASLTSTFVLLGLQTGVGRYLPRFEDPAERRGVLLSGFTITLPLGLLAGTAIVLGAPLLASAVFNSPEITPVLRVFGLIVPLMVVFQMVVSTIQGQQRSAPKVVIESIARPVTRITAIGVVILVGISSLRIAWAYFVGWLVPVAIGLAYLYRETDLFSFGSPAVTKRREMLQFSVPLLLSTAFSFVINDLDTLLLGYFSATPEPVGIYGVIYPIATILNSAIAAFSFVFMPVISELHAQEKREQVSRIYQVVTKWVFMTTFPAFLVIVLFPEKTISLTFGAKYASGGLALSILIIGFFVNTVVGLNRRVLVSVGATRVDMYVSASAATLNAVLNVVLIPAYGVVGAAIATAVTFVFRNVVVSTYLYYEERVFPVSKSLLRPGIIGGLAFLVVYAVIGEYLTPSPLTLVGGFAAFAIIYGIAVLRFGGIEQEEVMLVRSFEEKYGIDLESAKRIARLFM
jgi:O-antigen/teichoic acid export membrane protein